MKTKVNLSKLIVGGVLFAAAISMMSCSKDSISESVVTQKTDVALVVSSSSGGDDNTTGKSVDVNRNDIPYSVSEIDVEFENLLNGHSASENFRVVEDGSGEDGFIIKDVAIGTNKVTASTKTSQPSSFYFTDITRNGNYLDAMQDLKDRVPYLLYKGERNSEIQDDRTNIVPIIMQPQNGRVYASFRFKGDTSVWYSAIIVATIYDANGNIIDTLSPILLSSGSQSKRDFVKFYWSDASVVTGARVVFDIGFCEDNSNTVVRSTQRSIEVTNGVNRFCNYGFSDEDLEDDIEGIDFTWVELEDDECQDCGSEEDNDDDDDDDDDNDDD